MRSDMIQQAAEYTRKRKRHKRWQKVVTCLGAAVVFCTTYALILPAITMEHEQCQLPEHTHSSNCYTQVVSRTVTEPICSLEHLNVHQHSMDCYTAVGDLVCGYANYMVHQHDTSCWDENGSLWCPLPEIEAHIHDDSCYSVSENEEETDSTETHTHEESCYTKLRGELLCELEEAEGHVHDDTCYTKTQGGLICTTEEAEGHAHSDACYTETSTLSCELPESEEHAHAEECYTVTSDLTCGTEESEGHVHSEPCYEVLSELTCTLEEVEGHAHTDDCYAGDMELTCTLPEGTEETAEEAIPTEETDVESEPQLICTEEEIILHTHSEECFNETGALICSMVEIQEHVHGENCFQTVEEPVDTYGLTCTLPESDGHTHDETCFDETGTPVCMIEETEGHWHTELCYGTWELTCNWIEHTHNEYCFPETEENSETTETPEETEYFCGIEAHLHDELCYDTEGNLICTLEEHEHTEECLTEEVVDEAEYFCGTEAHLHDELCYDTEGNLICTLEEHEHTEECLTEETVDETEYFCGIEAHLHDELCYDTDGNLTCTLEEHEHTEACKTAANLSEDEQTLLADIIAMIDTLPSVEEVETTLLALEEAEDWEGYEAYFLKIGRHGLYYYDLYQRLSPEGQAQVTNIDKLMDLAWLWSAVTLAQTDVVNIYAVNQFNWNSGYGGALIAYSDSDTTISGIGMDESAFKYWYAIVVEKENGVFVVKQIYTDGDGNKTNVSVPADGFVLLYHISTLGATVNVEVGDIATVSSDFYKTTTSYNKGKVYGTVTFWSAAAQKASKNNSSELTIVDGADTRDFIEVNLYNYGSGSTGNNINAPHTANKSLPGFQQNGGTTSIATFDSTSYFNFGDIVTDDPNDVDGTKVTSSSASPTGINVVKGSANSPISRYSDVMHETLVNGYPALADQTSLSYLFGGTYGGTSYSKKMNSQSVNGLFQQNSITGAYFFDSRTNFAEFNSGSDTFTLYDEIFTPNFIMYPFGNFMPFNDIVYDSKQVSQIDKDYFFELMRHANYMYEQTSDDRYSQLAKVLGQCIDYADQAGWDSNWTAEDLLAHYFTNGSELPEPDDDANNYNQISLDRLYSLDYDEESDFYFGMEIKMNFMQPKSGLTGNDNGDNDAAWTIQNGNYVRSGDPDGIPDYPLTFNFAGDDDVWVYVDDVLFLDLSGIHRHVGGRIDFAKGEVYYYSLDTSTGDVDTANPYKTVTFADILTAAGKSTDVLNSSGTFKDYSAHNFHFYYMERGSGSSVCRMNFNFPVLQENSVSVSKELSSDTQSQLAILGNPDFKFQVLKADSSGNKTDTLFIGAGVTYSIYDSGSNLIGTGKTDANGMFTLKAGQRAEFTGITENSGKYYVRELLDSNTFEQYGSITVDGTSTTTSLNVKVGSDTFTGLDSPIKDVSDGTTVFTFDNQFTFNKLGSLEISKVLTEYNPLARMVPTFDFEVTLDGTPIPVGTAYTLTDAGGNETNAAVITAGIVTVPAGSTAKIELILAGTVFHVKETAASAKGYSVKYTGSTGVTSDGTSATGTIVAASSVNVTVTNGEDGTTASIPVSKTVTNPDSTVRDYVFTLQQVTSLTDLTPIGESQSITLNVNDTASGAFPLVILEKDIDTFPAALYYLITEKPDADTNILYDSSQYIVEVIVDSDLVPEVKSITKDGVSADSVTFTNALTGSLSLEKLAEGIPTDTEFSFSIQLDPGTSGLAALPTSYSATFYQQDGTVETNVSLSVNSDGMINLTGFKHGEKAVIHGIPLGAAWTITENNADAYRVRWTADGGTTVTQGSTAAGTVTGAVEVTFTNSSIYKLPETGGAGTQWYTMGGLLLMAAAGLFLLYHKTRRKEDAASP